MDQAKLEELVMAAAEKPTPKNLQAILAELRSGEGPVAAAAGNALNLLWENWNEEELDPVQANFCMELAALPIPDSASFRRFLTGAVKLLLPPYLNRTPVLRALGLRDESVPLLHVIGRFKKLISIKNGTVLFMHNSGRWGTISNIDNVTGTVAVSSFGTSGTTSATPLELVLVSGVLLNPGLDVLKIADVTGRNSMSSSEFRSIAAKRSLTPLTEQHMQMMARAGVGSKLSVEDFDHWWSSEGSVPSAQPARRRACHGRSLQEILLLMENEGDEKLSEEEVAAFEKFFSALKADVIKRESKRLAEVLVRVAARASADDMKAMMALLKDRVPFWPVDPMRCSYDAISVWSELAAKDIEKLAKVTAAVFPPEYLAACAMRLPLKAVNAIAPLAQSETLADILEEQRNYTADLALWIWKNRKKASADLLDFLGIDSIIRALSQENLPKAWTPALREMRQLLMDNAEFQKFLIVSSGDPLQLAAALQGALFLSSGERQSLIVKLSRNSAALREHLEGGAGQRIIRAGTSQREQEQVNTADEPNYTSSQSHKRLQKELDDIINIHKPENREALKIARAHGDFRENSEFDAAKERRNFLTRRQNELQRELLQILPMDMRQVQVEDVAVIGSTVELKLDDGTTETHYLLGAWDGNPDKHYLSYKTRLGQVLYGRSKGSEVELPGGRKATLTAVSPLPESVLADLETDI